MSGFSEKSTIQAAIVDRLTSTDMGWMHIPGAQLDRTATDVFCEQDLIAALVRLNPVIAEQPSRVDEILPKLRALVLSAGQEGLVAANERMMGWLRGWQTHKFIGTDVHVPIRLVDFDNPNTNTLVVSDEVTFRGIDSRRFDIVLWVNGIPMVVGETKTPVDMEASWLDAAQDVADVYQHKTGGFFVPNVFSFGTDGREYHYGAVGQPAETWLPWGSTTDPLTMPPMARTLRSVELMCSPESVLRICESYMLFSSRTVGPETLRTKIIPRYPQVEGVEAILERVADPEHTRGLLWHHQGSGKTYLMAFAAARLVRDPSFGGPTVLVVLDRLDLIDQITGEFTSAGVPKVQVAGTKEQLRSMLTEDTRGVIITTIFRFHDADVLNRRTNIVVLIDEAHRTQEGRLGAEMRAALPNAQLFGLTGTPVSDADRNTFATFGDPSDPGHVMSHYSMERSIADGATLPVHVETRLVDFHLDRSKLDSAFDELVDEEGLSDEERDLLVRRAGSVAAYMKDEDRITAVCNDIVDHWWVKLRPLGLKAQVVAYDREMCVAYESALRKRIGEKMRVEGGDGSPQVQVVMTVGNSKGEPETWSTYSLTRTEENQIKARFLDVHDPLSILVVTAKLLTGFDAPIEGVMYLDKPLKAHTLFQAITRTNRRWTNPLTGQEKRYGLVVDYVGVGKDIAAALQAASPEGGKQPVVDVDTLIDELTSAITTALERFDGIDRSDAGFASLLEAQQRLEGDAKDLFAGEFDRCEALWEFLYYDPKLKAYEDDYRWLAKVYASVQPASTSNALLWHRLGQKTLELVHGAITNVQVASGNLDDIIVDDAIVAAIKQLDLPIDIIDPAAPVTAQQVLDTIKRRLARKLQDSGHPVWKTLSDRLEALRAERLARAEDSVEFLKKLLELAQQVLAAEKAEKVNSLDEYESALPDPHIGALTQIFIEYAPDVTPDIVEHVVDSIDTIASQVRGTGWQTSHPADRQVRQEIRKTLLKYGLAPSGELFNRAYAYIQENY